MRNYRSHKAGAGKSVSRGTPIISAEQANGEALIDLARKRFDFDLRPIEQQVMLHSCAYEDPCECSKNDPERTSTGRPLGTWQGSELRPALIRWILNDPEAATYLEPRGLRVWNARLVQPLDLTGCRITSRLELRHCLFEAPILLAAAELPSLSLRSCTLQQVLSAPGLRVHGSVLLEDITADTLRFDAAKIEGGVRMSSVTLTAEGNALSMQGASIADDLQLRPELHCAGFVSLRGIRVGGLISFSGATLTARGNALNLDQGTVHGNVFLRDGFQSAGEIRMVGAEIGGQLDCSSARLTAVGTAFSLDHSRIRGSVLMGSGFEAVGVVQMCRTKIGGNLNFEEASIRSFRGDGMEVGSDFIWRQLSAPGRTSLDLTDARIKRFRDDHASWPEKDMLRVNGLITQNFDPLEDRSKSHQGRLDWLNLQCKDDLAKPHPWMQLAEIFRLEGQKHSAKHVIREFRRHQSRQDWKDSSFKPLGYVWNCISELLEKLPISILFAVLIFATLGNILSPYFITIPFRKLGLSGRASQTAHPRPAPVDSAAKVGSVPIAVPQQLDNPVAKTSKLDAGELPASTPAHPPATTLMNPYADLSSLQHPAVNKAVVPPSGTVLKTLPKHQKPFLKKVPPHRGKRPENTGSNRP